ncbi:hypothetical protein T4D_9155 [Trichinella pseudospiralis]|uniref:Uncharacterized protein n=1 Tax=Trichinella pseudospiralis TaxID=6337 RepID=A0A0V1FMC3_TRIPS|nr:hypothetical protein T4D_9155 [Trichinella pseudospiralis]
MQVSSKYNIFVCDAKHRGKPLILHEQYHHILISLVISKAHCCFHPTLPSLLLKTDLPMDSNSAHKLNYSNLMKISLSF